MRLYILTDKKLARNHSVHLHLCLHKVLCLLVVNLWRFRLWKTKVLIRIYKAQTIRTEATSPQLRLVPM